MKLTKFMSMIMLGSMVTGSVVCAESISLDTKGEANFIQGNEVENPENPGGEIPVDPPEIGEGPLQINYVPNLLFGTHKITTEKEVYNATAVKTVSEKSVPLYAKVSDKRGKGTGWTLNVKLADEFVHETNASILTGAQIDMKVGTAFAKNGIVSTTATKEISLSGKGAAADILVASGEKGNEGMGTHWIQWGTGKDEHPEIVSESKTEGKEGTFDRMVTPNVQLTIPGNVDKYEGQYKTKLIWSLEEKPSESII